MNVYLYFNGNCDEVFAFYKSVFGGEFESYQTFGDGPQDMGVPDEAKDLVMHVSLPLGDAMLMGSDGFPGGPPVSSGNNFAIAIPATSRAHCDQLFAQLQSGGVVTMELQETFWGSYFGSLTDKYGINWMFNFPLESD